MTDGRMFTLPGTAVPGPESDEWYTPPRIFDALGLDFDLDPCASPGADFVPARRKIRLPEDGLAVEWAGQVWLNPPYSNPGPWLARMAHCHGVALVSVQSDARWWQDAARAARSMCFIQGKVVFIDGRTGEQPPLKNGARFPSVLIGYGSCGDAVHGCSLGVSVRL